MSIFIDNWLTELNHVMAHLDHTLATSLFTAGECFAAVCAADDT